MLTGRSTCVCATSRRDSGTFRIPKTFQSNLESEGMVLQRVRTSEENVLQLLWIFLLSPALRNP